MFMGLSNTHILRTIEMTQDLCLPMPHVYGTLKHSHTQNNRNDTKTCVSQCPMFMGLSNIHTLRTIEMTQDLCLPMPHVYGTLKHSHTQNNRNDTRLVSPNAPCLWDSSIEIQDMSAPCLWDTQNNRNDTRLVSPNAPCLWDSKTLAPSEQ